MMMMKMTTICIDHARGWVMYLPGRIALPMDNKMKVIRHDIRIGLV